MLYTTMNYLKPVPISRYAVLLVSSLMLPLLSIFCKAQSVQQLQDIMSRAGTPGLQLAFYSPEQVSQVSLGVKKYGTQDTVNDSTRFQAASLTKVITTYAFLKLMDRGLIALDSPLYHYYPYDRLRQTKDAEKITARMVLTHRSGLMNWQGDVPTAAWRNTPLTLQFAPGTQYLYSGEGFYFLQETLEHITQKNFQEIIEEEVFAPLQMYKSNIVWNDTLQHNAAYGHYQFDQPRTLGKYLKSNAAYTMYTTASDYLHFIQQAILEGKGLTPQSHTLMLSRLGEVQKEKHKTHIEDQYVPCALGLRMQINEQGTAYWHTGSNPGFRCFFITYPQSKQSLVVFLNSDSGFLAMKELMEVFIRPQQTFWAYEWRQGELD